MNPLVEYLNRFVDLSTEECIVLESLLEHKRFNSGEFVLKEGVICKKIAFLVSGTARTYFIDSHGHDFTWNFQFNDNDAAFHNIFMLDYYSLLTQSPSSLSIKVISDVEVVMLDYQNLQSLIGKYIKMAIVSNKLTELAYQYAHKRAFSLLTLNAKDRYSKLLQEEPYLINKFNQNQIASFIGVTPQSLSRLRKDLPTL